MSQKLLTEIGRSTLVESTATCGDYKMYVSYSIANGNKINYVRCNLARNAGLESQSNQIYVGYMALEGTNKTMNFNEGVDSVACISAFEGIIEEIKQTLEE